MMRNSVVQWVVVGVCIPVLAACSGRDTMGDDTGVMPPTDSSMADSSTDGAPTDADAGTDAGPMDAELDAGPMDAGPMDAELDAGPPPETMTPYSLGENHTCVLEDAEGRVRCWGYNRGQQLGIGSTDSVADGIVMGVIGAVELAAGGYHTCARLADGTVTCWGRNEEGQLGTGATSAVELATAVSGLAGVTEIDASANTTCARVADAVHCWGSNGSDQIDVGGADAIDTPTEVGALSGATAIAVGNYHICAIVGGAVVCTGSSIGTATFGDPVASSSSGWQHSCGVAGRATYCWGDGYLGTLGDGLTGSGVRPQQLVTGVPATAVEVRTGIYHSCALIDGGDLWCWGNNQGGAIDPDAAHDPGHLPAVVASGVTAFDVGGVHTCVTDTSGFRCWGNDWAGAVSGMAP